MEDKEDSVEVMNLKGTEKIVIPKNTIKSTVKLKKKNADGKKKVEGFIKAEDDEKITLVKKDGSEIAIAKADIKKVRKGYRKPAVMSIMPGNFRDLLSVKNLHDIVAFLKAG